MNEIDKLIRAHQQALTTAQAAKIVQLERENARAMKEIETLKLEKARLVDTEKKRMMQMQRKEAQA